MRVYAASSGHPWLTVARLAATPDAVRTAPVRRGRVDRDILRARSGRGRLETSRTQPNPQRAAAIRWASLTGIDDDLSAFRLTGIDHAFAVAEVAGRMSCLRS